MSQGGTSFWKVFFGVLGAIIVATGCVIGACVVLIGRAAVGISRAEAERREYASKVDVSFKEFVIGDNYGYVRGSVTNRGTRTVTYWRVAAQYLDRAGNVVDTDFTNSADRLGPGESKNYEIMHRTDQRVRRANVSIEEVRIE